jgi:hypothetical protein
MRSFLALVLLTFAGFAQAATLYVTEFQTVNPSNPVVYQAARAPALANQTVAIGGSSTQSSAFNTATGLVRIHVDAIACVAVGGTNPTATTSLMRMTAGQTEYFVVSPGDKLAVIACT